MLFLYLPNLSELARNFGQSGKAVGSESTILLFQYPALPLFHELWLFIGDCGLQGICHPDRTWIEFR